MPSDLEQFNRRQLLLSCGTAGTLAATAVHFLSRDQQCDKLLSSTDQLDAPRRETFASPAHFVPRAKNVIFLFMAGAPSQLDLYDPKPELQRWAGQPLPESLTKELKLAFIRPSAKALPSRRSFAPRGESGIEISDWLPTLHHVADDLCLIRSMQTDAFNHHPGQSLLMSGSQQGGRPSLGSWATYGLGCESQNLPAFVVLTSGFQGPEGGTSNWSNGFLPANHRGVVFQPTGNPIPYLGSPPGVNQKMQVATIDALRDLNARRFERTGDDVINARMAAYEMAFRMQSSAPELMNLDGESKYVHKLYALDDEACGPYARNCLLARRMIERGVRFVMLADASWDGHNFINANHTARCRATDRPVAALLIDLKQRGMLDDTLVIWGGEFGRTPMAEIVDTSKPDSAGRDHHANGFSMWMAGGGTRAGHVIGKTDELGLSVVDQPVHIHDLQATILHCLGLDHERLTYRHQGRDFRLTDVAGNVVTSALA